MHAGAFVNRITTAVPRFEVHRFFLDYAASMLAGDPRRRSIFARLADLSGIERRYSSFEPADDPAGGSIDKAGAWKRGGFPGTAERMDLYEQVAPMLAEQAVAGLELSPDRSRITHLIVTSCTGFSAPGIDLELVERCGLSRQVERTMIGFMGCYAAINALKLSRHIVRSDPAARVLIVNIEICTLHLRETQELEELASFCLWGDGCAAALVTAEPHGLSLDRFHVLVARERRDLMTWNIRDDGYHMVLSGQVPAAIQETLRSAKAAILDNKEVSDIDLWAVHPGGRTVLDAVERALGLGPAALAASRDVLRHYGNMSSATVMFVLEKMLREPPRLQGCGMAFGPGLTAETMLFHTV